MPGAADVAQLVEHQLPKLRVAGSIPVVRFPGGLTPPGRQYAERVRTAVVVPGHHARDRCLHLVREAERVVAEAPVEVVVFSGRSRRGALSEAEQMRAAWRGPDVELIVEPTASVTAENASRTLPLLLERGTQPVLPLGRVGR